MNAKYSLSDNILSLKYGLVVVTFGIEAVDKVIKQPKWAKKYPDLIQKILSEDLTKGNVILPGEIIYEIAGRDECRDDYYADPDGKRLYAGDRSRKSANLSTAEKRGYSKIPNQEALLTYGAYCLFAASDRGVGYKGERGLPTDHSRK